MKLIKPSYEIMPQEEGVIGIFKQIELAGRTCYKSEKNIKEDSAKELIDRMIKSGHGAMLEHGTVYLCVPIGATFAVDDVDKYDFNKYSKIVWGTEGLCITTNYRVLVENGWLDDLEYICEPTIHEKRVSVRFICDRGVSHEFVRHRVMSFAQESTRFCNYSKDNFDKQITYIIPCWVKDIEEGVYKIRLSDKDSEKPNRLYCENPAIEDDRVDDNSMWFWSLANNEITYNQLIHEGWLPQQARAILPNSLKTELVVTGFVSDWKHFFSLRDDKSAHPQAQELATPLHKEFKNLKLI